MNYDDFKLATPPEYDEAPHRERRTLQDLLAERRALVQEQRYERDAMARKLLQAQIDIIDDQIESRRKEQP